MTRSILIVDDQPDMCRMLERGLTTAGFTTASCATASAALERLHDGGFGVVLTDIRMPRTSGIELCRRIGEIRPDIPVIVTTAFGNIEAAIESIRAGAYDFLVKPFELDAVRIAVRRALERHMLVERVRRLEHALEGEPPIIEGMIGRSNAIRATYELVQRVGVTDTTVLITGESGTGKELVAKALHRGSHRSTGPFVAINCSAMPENLLESELFGHVRGAFTDAKTDRKGLFLQGERGTVFLDEIGEIPLPLQPKLLRALQERKLRPVGGLSEIPFDARIIAATNRDLALAVQHGEFREDLFYRVNVVEIDLPPLRARGNDVLLLAHHFMTRFASLAGRTLTRIDPSAAEKLVAYPWPGNVRELQNCIERAVILSRHTELCLEDLPERIRAPSSTQVVVEDSDLSSFVPMEEVERRYVERVFAATGCNKSLAASILGFNRKTLYRKLKAYGLLPPSSPGEDDSTRA